jgi:hypothetical protein
MISLSIPESFLLPGGNVVKLKFPYQQWLFGVPLGMTAAFLDRIDIL